MHRIVPKKFRPNLLEKAERPPSPLLVVSRCFLFEKRGAQKVHSISPDVFTGVRSENGFYQGGHCRGLTPGSRMGVTRPSNRRPPSWSCVGARYYLEAEHRGQPPAAGWWCPDPQHLAESWRGQHIPPGEASDPSLGPETSRNPGLPVFLSHGVRVLRANSARI